MDNLLIYLVQSYNKEALDLLVEKYRKLIQIWANDIMKSFNESFYFDWQIIQDDIEITLYQTIERYDPSKGVFYSYLKGAVYNTIMNHIRTNNKNNSPTISLNFELDDDVLLIDSLSSNDNLSQISERYNVLEEIELVCHKINSLKEEDQKILYLKMQGFTNEEISSMINTNIRKVNYISRKIKKM